nr:SUMF1/EgtB/PvdO family nonheme iron enzyme [Candidatus Hydrogenedentota bacterium]
MNRGHFIRCLLCLALACAGAAAQRGSGGTAAGPAPQKWAVLVGAGETRPPVVVAPPAPPQEPEPGEVRVFEGGEFAWIPAGTFEMGSKLSPERVIATYGGEAESKQFHEGEHPRHTVTLTRGFWLATKEVTVGEFRAFADA